MFCAIQQIAFPPQQKRRDLSFPYFHLQELYQKFTFFPRLQLLSWPRNHTFKLYFITKKMGVVLTKNEKKFEIIIMTERDGAFWLGRRGWFLLSFISELGQSLAKGAPFLANCQKHCFLRKKYEIDLFLIELLTYCFARCSQVMHLSAIFPTKTEE